MRRPPDGQKEREQQALQMSAILNPAGLNVEAAALAVLKSGFDAHAPRIFLNLSIPSFLITDEQPSFLAALVPDQAHKSFECLLLPDTCFAIPARARLEHNLPKAFPGLLQFPLEVGRQVCS